MGSIRCDSTVWPLEERTTMKLLRVGPRGHERPAVLGDDGVVHDVSTLVDDYDQAFFASGGVERLRAAWVQGAAGLPALDLGGLRVGAPIAKPYQVLCIGLNYADHARESGLEPPAEPVVFNKGPATVIGPDDDVMLPPASEKSDWEVELGVIVGRSARYLLDEEAAAACIAGYVISNDLSERAYQLERGGQWVKGKSCETFNPCGPWLVTPNEVDDVQDLDMVLRLNGEPVQRGSTRTMIFTVAHIVWYLSQFMVLEPGDLINTGTPPGVGLGMDPPRYLHEGDTMELEISGLGTQRQVCRRAEVVSG
jgi:2,4-diketo-3-deoxy-L-fuconate hydrolase